MRKFILVLIFLFLCSLQVNAASNHIQGGHYQGGVVGGGGAVALSCTGATIQQQDTTNSAMREIGEYATTDYWGYKVTYSGTTGTVCSLKVTLSRNNDTSPTGNLYIYFRADNSSHPSGSNLSTGSYSGNGYIAMTSLTTTPTEYTFSMSDATISNGTVYWIVAYYDSANSTNFPKFAKHYGASGEDDSADGSAWTNIGTSGPVFKIYIKE